MSRWGAALAGAAGAVANVGVGAIDNQIKLDQQIDAEKRAADLQLDTHQRMAAADEMMKNRAAERFATLTKDKLGEDVPADAPSVQQTGLTDASAGALITGADGAPVNVAFHGDQAANLKAMQAIIDSPNATPQQRQDAQQAIDAITAQTKQQQSVNAKSVDGKTRKRTVAEARDAAFDDAAVNDAPAYMAGQSMWRSALENDRDDKKLKQQSTEKDKDRASLEKRTGMQVDQRAESTAAETARKTQADADRAANAQARIKTLGARGGQATALMKNRDYMINVMGKTPEEADKLLFVAKDSSEAEKVFKLMLHDKFGELSAEDAFKKVRGISDAAGTSKPAGGNDKVRTWNPKTRKFE